MEPAERGEMMKEFFSFIDDLDDEVEKVLFSRWLTTISNFFGHLATGCILIILSFFWTKTIVNHYVLSQIQEKSFESILWKSSPIFSCLRLQCATAYNGLLLSLAILEIVVLISSFDDQGRFGYYDNAQHLVMYSGFVFHFLVVNLQLRKILVMPSADYMSLAVVYCIKAVILSNHLSGKNSFSPLRGQVHAFLAIVVITLSVVIVFEMFVRHHFPLSILRCYLCLVEGTWISHIGIIIFRAFEWQSAWDPYSRKSNIFCTSIFAGHCLVNLIIIMIFVHFFILRFKRQNHRKYISQEESNSPLLIQESF